jgi:2,5-diketo-D-gluconate reductase A
MDKKNHRNRINRREFLETGVKFGATALFMGLGTSKLFGVANTNQTATSIETVTLNNGVQMPILGFGTL